MAILVKTSCSDEIAARHLQVEAVQTASHNVASCRSTCLLWAGCGFAALILIGISARAALPAASHASAKPSQLFPSVAFDQANGQAVAFLPATPLPGTAARPSVTARQQRNGQQQRQPGLTVRMGIAEYLAGMRQEFDDFVDDAMNQRLGNGPIFYGKRKSAFHGQNDDLRKENPRIARADEDYAVPYKTQEEANSAQLKMDFEEAVRADRQRIEKELKRNADRERLEKALNQNQNES